MQLMKKTHMDAVIGGGDAMIVAAVTGVTATIGAAAALAVLKHRGSNPNLLVVIPAAIAAGIAGGVIADLVTTECNCR